MHSWQWSETKLRNFPTQVLSLNELSLTHFEQNEKKSEGFSDFFRHFLPHFEQSLPHFEQTAFFYEKSTFQLHSEGDFPNLS